MPRQTTARNRSDYARAKKDITKVMPEGWNRRGHWVNLHFSAFRPSCPP